MPISPAHFIRSILTLGLAQVFTWIGGAAMAVLLPRYLGDSNLGKIAFGLAFTTLVGLVADLGTATYLTKEVARAPEQAMLLTTNTLFMRLALGAVATCVALVVINVAQYDEVTRAIVIVLCAGMVVVALSNAVVATLQGLQQIKALAGFSIVTRLGYAAMAIGVLFGGAGPLEVAGAWVASQALGLALVLVALIRVFRTVPWAVPDRAVLRLLLIGGLPFFMWQAALMVYGQVDAVLLSLLTQDAVVGWYAAAYRLVTIPLFLPTIVMTVVFPAMSASVGSPHAFSALARRAVHIVLLPSLPMVLGIMLLSDKIITFLGYPESFSHSIAPMVLLAPHIVLVGVNMVIGTVLNTRDRQRQWAFAAVFAAILNPLLNLPAILLTQNVYGNGAIGASAVTTCTELFMLAAGLHLLPRQVLTRQTALDAIRCLAAGLLMSIVVWVARDLPLVVPVALGAVVYCGGCLLVGAVSIPELKQVLRHVVHTPTLEAAS